jgi:hypothetical protein
MAESYGVVEALRTEMKALWTSQDDIMVRLNHSMLCTELITSL